MVAPDDFPRSAQRIPDGPFGQRALLAGSNFVVYDHTHRPPPKEVAIEVRLSQDSGVSTPATPTTPAPATMPAPAITPATAPTPSTTPARAGRASSEEQGGYRSLLGSSSLSLPTDSQSTPFLGPGGLGERAVDSLDLIQVKREIKEETPSASTSDVSERMALHPMLPFDRWVREVSAPGDDDDVEFLGIGKFGELLEGPTCWLQ